MKKALIASIVLIVLASTVLATHFYRTPFQVENKGAYGLYSGVSRVVDYDPRVTGYIKIEEIVYLEPIDGPANIRGYSHYAPRGTARFNTGGSLYYPRGQVLIQVKDVPTTYDSGSILAGYLFDEESGHALKLGVFETRQGGVGILQYRIQQALDKYDYVVITKEAEPDHDPMPSDDIVLWGQITKPSGYTEATFTSQERLFGKGLG